VNRDALCTEMGREDTATNDHSKQLFTVSHRETVVSL